MQAPTRAALAALLLLGIAGCPKPPRLPPPPPGGGGPAARLLAERDARIDAVRANAVIRTRLPEGRPGAPGSRVSAIAIVAARPERARLEILTPLGTPGATLLLAEGLLQIYEPFANRLTKAPLDSPAVRAQLGNLPVPLGRLPSLLRGVPVLESGDVTEVAAPVLPDDEEAADATPHPTLEVRRDGRVIQAIRMHATGGYPLEELRYDGAGVLVSRVLFQEHGGVETPSGPVAFPQKILARLFEDGAEAGSVELRLSAIRLDPKLDEDTFRLVTDGSPEVHEL